MGQAIPKISQKNGNGLEKRVIDLEGHADVANHEMLEVVKTLERIEKSFSEHSQAEMALMTETVVILRRLQK